MFGKVLAMPLFIKKSSMENEFEFEQMEHVVLQDDKVLLRIIKPEDAIHLVDFGENEPDLFLYTLAAPDSKDKMVAYVQNAVHEFKNKISIPFIVYDKQQLHYAGTTRIYDFNWKFKSMTIGFTWYGKAYQGTGLNKHCKYLLLSYAFEELGMERVEFRADSQNEHSIAAMKSIGCTVEGIMRSHMPNNTGGRRHSIILSILKDEWLNSVKAMLHAKLK